jgi:hypothetical protein
MPELPWAETIVMGLRKRIFVLNTNQMKYDYFIVWPRQL